MDTTVHRRASGTPIPAGLIPAPQRPPASPRSAPVRSRGPAASPAAAVSACHRSRRGPVPPERGRWVRWGTQRPCSGGRAPRWRPVREDASAPRTGGPRRDHADRSRILVPVSFFRSAAVAHTEEYGDIVDSSPNSITAEPLGGRYQLGEVIGRGGMASVYTAKDLNLGRDVALKLFAPQSADPDELRRQEAEIELLATLNHPSLVTLFDAGTDTRIPEEPRPFLTMELVDGQDLRTRIRHSPVPLDELAVIGAGVADALAYVHAPGHHPPGHQAGQHPAGAGPPGRAAAAQADRLRHRPDHRRRPGSRPPEPWWAPPPTSARNRPAAPTSARRATSTPWASSCSNASRAKWSIRAAPWNPPWPGCTAPPASRTPSRPNGHGCCGP